MRRLIGLVISGLAVSGLLTAQTLNIQVGNVLYQFPAAQTYSMPFENGETLTVMGKSFALSEIGDIYVDETAVTDGSVQVAFSDESADITVAGNIARFLTITQSGAHVSIVQSSDLAEEITYTLSGSSADGGFYTEGSYKATVELDNLTLTNKSAVPSAERPTRSSMQQTASRKVVSTLRDTPSSRRKVRSTSPETSNTVSSAASISKSRTPLSISSVQPATASTASSSS